MSIDDLVKLIDSLTRLLGALVWPVLLAYTLVRFGPSLKEFFARLGELSLKGGGFEATVKSQKAEATSALVAATVSRPDAATTPQAAAREAAEVVTETVNARTIRRARGATILWVDDNPNNNTYERQSLEALGVSFVLATSTDELLTKLAARRFDVIISDMNRPPDPHAGFTLLEKLRASGDQTPFIIYAGSKAPEYKAEALRRGALGCTNRPSELFEYVLTALRSGG